MLRDLTRANLRNADMQMAVPRGAVLAGADLDKTDLRGANLSDVKNLTPEQLAQALVDETTKLSGSFSRV